MGGLVMGGFKELEVWRSSMDLAVKVYKLTSSTPLEKDFGLRDQIRRSAISVPSHIAEEDERNSNPDSIRHFRIAKGSLAEIRTQLKRTFEIGYPGLFPVRLFNCAFTIFR
jgi:four helix bundle protein